MANELSSGAKQILGLDFVKSNGDVKITDDVKIGVYQNGKFTSAQDSLSLLDNSFRASSELDTPQNLSKTPTQPTGSFRGRHSNTRIAPTGRPNWAFSGDHVLVMDKGAGVNGPLSAGYGRTTMWYKEGYPSSSVPFGEGDVQLILGQQCGPTATSLQNCSDLDGIQGNLRISGDCGYVAGVEWNIGRINPTTFAETNIVSFAGPVYDPFGKNQEQGLDRYAGVNPLAFGVYVGADKGKADRGLFVTNGPEGYFEWGLWIGAGNAPKFRVKLGTDPDAGTLVFGPDNGGYTTGINPDGNFQISTVTGPALVISQNKVASFSDTISSARVNVAGVEMLTSRNTLILPQLSGPPSNPLFGEIANFGGKIKAWDGTVWQSFW